MTQCRCLYVTLSNSQLHKLKSPTKNATEVALKLSLSMVGESSDDSNFTHKLWLTDRKISKLHESFVNNSSAIIKLWKNWIV